MATLKVNDLSIGDFRFKQDKASYPSLPTVYSGVDIQWGAGSCIEHPDPSRAQLTLWIPKTHEDYVPELGDVVYIEGGSPADGPFSAVSASLFKGRVESVKLSDDHLPHTFVPPVMTNLAPAATLNGTWTIDTEVNNARMSALSWTTLANGALTITRPPNTLDTDEYWVYTPKFNVSTGSAITFEAPTTDKSVSGLFVSYVYNKGTAEVTGTYKVDNGTIKQIPNYRADQMYFGYKGVWGSATSITLGPFTAKQLTGFQVLPNPPGYRVSIVAADALAEAARLRISDVPWAPEAALSRLNRIYYAASKSGLVLDGGISEAEGYYEALDVYATARDVDSASALEVYQRTLMTFGHVAVSKNYQVVPSQKLELPSVLSLDTTGVSTLYSWADNNTQVSGFKSKSYKKVNGVTTRTNEAYYPAAWPLSVPEYSTVAGTGGVVSTANTFVSTDTELPPGVSYKYGWGRKWTTSATGGSQGLVYTDYQISGATGTRLSAGMWVAFSETKSVRLVLTALFGSTPMGTISGPIVTVPKGVWVFLKAEGLTATGAYTVVEALAQVQTSTNMQANQSGSIGAVIIEKTPTIGTYFDGNSVDGAATVTITENAADSRGTPLPSFPTKYIEDDTFEIDTSHVVNQIKLEYFEEIWDGTKMNFEEQSVAIDDIVGLAKTTPQQRSLSMDLLKTYGTTIESQFMHQKAQLLLAGQSTPQWRLSDGLQLVLSEMPDQFALFYLLDEATRFGQLIKIPDAPSRIDKYFRVKGGRIVLGEDPMLEFEIEPVEYSAPTPLSTYTLAEDDLAFKLRISNFKTISSNDLRTIGAR